MSTIINTAAQQADRTQWTREVTIRIYGQNLAFTVTQWLDLVDDMHDEQSDNRRRILDAIRPYVSSRQLESARFTRRVEVACAG